MGNSIYWHVVRHNRDFRYLWFGQIVSLLGDWFNFIASATLLARLTHSGVAVGLLFVLRMLAPFLISPLAGVASDRYDRKFLLILADVARGLLVLGFLAVQDVGDVWLLYTLTFMQLAVSGFFYPARSAILPNIVAPRELGAANAISSATWSVMLAFGTGLGGLVAGVFGVELAFIIDALSFFVSAIFILRVQYGPKTENGSRRKGGATAFQQYVDGLRYLKKHRDILAIVLHKAALALTTSGALQVIQVAIADRLYVVGEGGGVGMGIMFAVVGVGTGVGPIVARRWSGDDGFALRIAIAVGFVMLTTGVAVTATLAGFGIVLFGLFLRGIGGGMVWVFSSQLLMQLVPDAVRGRIFATEFALFTLMGALSAAASGWLIDTAAVGLAGTLLGMAVLCLIPAVAWSWYVAKRRPAR